MLLKFRLKSLFREPFEFALTQSAKHRQAWLRRVLKGEKKKKNGHKHHAQVVATATGLAVRVHSLDLIRWSPT